MTEDKIKNAKLNYEIDLQNWEKEKKACESSLGACGGKNFSSEELIIFKGNSDEIESEETIREIS